MMIYNCNINYNEQTYYHTNDKDSAFNIIMVNVPCMTSNIPSLTWKIRMCVDEMTILQFVFASIQFNVFAVCDQ